MNADGVIVKLPVDLLGEIVAGSDRIEDAVRSLGNLMSEWALIERVVVPATSDEDEHVVLRTFSFESRELLVHHLEHSHVDPGVEIVAVLKNGSPRNAKIKVQVQFR